ncbi:MAG: DUF4157 domain-containing protein [Nitrospira sp.]|nr:DUF4157 domain-containing protein [Nitrospira sp.]
MRAAVPIQATDSRTMHHTARSRIGDLSDHIRLSQPFGEVPLYRKTSCACGGACPACQAKSADLKISQPNDPAEIEADRIADRVIRMPVPETHSIVHTSQASNTIHRQCDACEAGDEMPVQRKPLPSISGALPGGPDHVRSAIDSGGRPLDKTIRNFFEPRLGYDLSNVRIHTDSTAEQSARAINARAYTLGSNIVFGSGEYKPELETGRHLIAHELAHTIQQTGHINRQDDMDAGTSEPGDADVPGAGVPIPGNAENPVSEQRICGPDITASLTTMLSTVEPWFRGLSGFQQSRSCAALGPGGFFVGVNPIMAWDTRELFLPNTGWLDAYFLRRSCGSPRDSGCDTDPTRNLCETAGTCGNSVLVDGKCMLAGTANYALFGKMCRLCHDYTGRWNRWDMRAIIGAYKTISGDDSTPPKEVASAAYDGTFPTVPAAAENRGTCIGRCGLTHGGAFDFIWEPYRSR